MDGTARVPEGLRRVERGFEWSRLSSQFVSQAYEQVVASGLRESSQWRRDDRGQGWFESMGTNPERRWAAGE